MTITINSNPAADSAIRQLGKTTNRLAKTFERLSTGLRINSGADDPGGLAIADSLRAQTTLAGAAIRNVNDGISLTSIADSATAEISTILSRLAELAQQSANGVYTNSQRSAVSLEFAALGSEVQRIAETTSFNGRVLLSNTTTLSLQVGFDSDVNSQIQLTGISATLDSLGLTTTTSGTLGYSINATTEEAAQSAALNALDAVNSALDSISTTRGIIGSTQSRLETAIGFLEVARENFAAADSQVRDADIASEVSRSVTLNLLQSSSVAIVGHANQRFDVVAGQLGF